MALLTTKITKEQSKDTGLAMTLIVLILGLWLEQVIYFKIAFVAVLITMTIPRIFYPLGIIWFSLSNVLGAVMSRVLLTAIFAIFVIPMGTIRRLMGKDSLQLHKFKKGRESVFNDRSHTYSGKDLENPY